MHTSCYICNMFNSTYITVLNNGAYLHCLSGISVVGGHWPPELLCCTLVFAVQFVLLEVMFLWHLSRLASCHRVYSVSCETPSTEEQAFFVIQLEPRKLHKPVVFHLSSSVLFSTLQQRLRISCTIVCWVTILSRQINRVVHFLELMQKKQYNWITIP